MVVIISITNVACFLLNPLTLPAGNLYYIRIRPAPPCLTLPPTFIRCERDSGGLSFAHLVGWATGLARRLADCAASGAVAGRRFSELGGRLPAKAGMGPFGIIIVAEGAQPRANAYLSNQSIGRDFYSRRRTNQGDCGLASRPSVEVKLDDHHVNRQLGEVQRVDHRASGSDIERQVAMFIRGSFSGRFERCRCAGRKPLSCWPVASSI